MFFSSPCVFPLPASPVTAMHRWWGESSSYVLLHLKSVLMARKAYILFPNEANHSGGFAPHSLNPSPYATASGNTHMHTHITVEVGPVMSDVHTQNTALKSVYYRANAKADKISLTRTILMTALVLSHYVLFILLLLFFACLTSLLTYTNSKNAPPA